MTLPLTEVCVEGIDGLLAAQGGGADRVELCASLAEGGLTPSLGVVGGALAVAHIPVNVIVRPRAGDFVYSEHEFQSMLDDVKLLRQAGVAGVVVGCLTAAGEVDAERTLALVVAAGPLSVTFHRAFDLVADTESALEILIGCRVTRVLTSGQQPSALEGRDTLKALLRQAGERIIILGCGRLRPDTVSVVLRDVPLREIHFSALETIPNRGPGRHRPVQFGQRPEEEFRRVTSAAQVAATIAAARQARKPG